MADGSVIIDTELDESGLRKGLSKLGGSVNSVLGTALKAASGTLSALGTYAYRVGADFEYAMSGVAATWDTTVDQIENVREKAIELGAATKFSATEAAEGFNILAQAGYTAEEAIALIDPVLNLAAAGELELAEAATYVSATWKVMGESLAKEGRDAAYVVDLYAKGATLAKTTTGELGDAVSTTAGYSSQFNQSLDTTTAMLLAMADANFNGAEAGTLLRRAMMNLYTPSKQSADALAELGVATYDANGYQRDMVDVIYDIQDAISGLTEQEQAAYIDKIFDTVQGQTAFNAIMTKSREELMALKGELNNCTGAAERMAKTKQDNLLGDIEELTSAAEGFGIAINKSMYEPLRDFVQEGTDLINQLHDAVIEGGLSGVAASVGDVLSQAVQKIAEYAPSFVSAAIDLIDSFISGISQSAPGIANIAVEVGNKLLEGFLSLYTGLVELGAELIIALCDGIAGSTGTLIATLIDGLSNFASTILSYIPEIITAGTQLIAGLATGILSAIPGVVESAGTLIESLLNVISESCTTILEAIMSVASEVVSALPNIISTIIDVLPQIVQSIVDTLMGLLPMIVECGITLLTSLVAALPDIISTIALALPELVSGITSALLGMIPQLVECGIQLFVALVQALPDIIANITSSLYILIEAIVFALIAAVPSIIECGIELLTALIAGLPQIILNVVAAIPAILAALVAALIDSIPTIIECGVNLLTSLIADLPSIIVAVVAAIPQIVSGLVQAIVGSVGQIAQAGIQLLTSLITALPNIISTIVRAIPQIVSAIVQAFLSLRGQLVEAGSNLLHGLADGIGNAIGAVVARAQAAAQAVVSSVKGFFGIASPSKVFREEIGKQLMLGLAGGIAGYATEAISAAEDAAEEIRDIDFTLPDPGDFPDPYGNVDFGALEANARMAVVSSTAGTQQKLTGTSIAEHASKSNGAVGTQVNIGSVNVTTDELKQDADFERVGRKMAESYVRKARVTGSLNPI